MSEAFLVSLYAQNDTVRLKFFHIHSGIILFIIISNTEQWNSKDLDIGLKNELGLSELVEKIYLKYHSNGRNYPQCSIGF